MIQQELKLNGVYAKKNGKPNKKGKKGSWSTKQRRCYQRIMSGIALAKFKNRRIRFFTLTTSDNSKRGLQEDFRVLKMRIKRKFGAFEYLRVKTNEGNGVIHLLYWGCYIPQRWLSTNWDNIHQSPIVDIRAIDRIRNLGAYIVTQYLCDQKTSFIRYAWSWAWVYKGFVGNWKKITREYIFKNAVEAWNRHLSGQVIRLDGKYLKPPPDVHFVELAASMLDKILFTFPYHCSAYHAALAARCDWLDK
jgi:hypothetical protein